MVNNLFITVILDDFNTKSNLYYNIDITTYEGSKIDGVTSQFGLQQIIQEPKCIELIFRTHPNLVVESGVHSSQHANCHHHITSAKFNLKIHYPPLYEREVWHYQEVYEQIRWDINKFRWDNCFPNTNVNEQVQLFTQTIQNIISTYVPHETINCDDRNPPWIDEKIKKLILHKNRAFSAYFWVINYSDIFNKFQSLQAHLKTTVDKSKLKY